jgi:hypothetical protein
LVVPALYVLVERYIARRNPAQDAPEQKASRSAEDG